MISQTQDGESGEEDGRVMHLDVRVYDFQRRGNIKMVYQMDLTCSNSKKRMTVIDKEMNDRRKADT